MDKKDYSVAARVNRVNGRAVSRSGRVSLTDAEALYDRALGRIRPAPIPQRRRRRKADGQ
ncbi:hypothetical protein V6617_10115 [Pelagibacterium nitratireducens]|uniref:Uncharacterized protein n=1 Tax=Pelagibacterium nitratireducens TaxID=1046114 RepID=A0ABZ2I1E9_9HYPH